jgi:hypothetical protein
VLGCHELLSRIARSALIRDHLHAELALVVAPGGFPSPPAWDLLVTDGATLSLVAQLGAEEPAPTLETLPRHRLLCATGRAARVRRFRAPDVGDVFDPAARLEPLGEVVLAPGEVLAVPARVEAVDTSPPGADGLLLELAGRPTGHIVGVYDAESLRAIAPVAADKDAARLEYMAWALAEMGDPSAAGAIAELFEHPAHFVRWTAVRAAGTLDESVGEALLARAADDPHPHVRRAARSALGMDDEGPRDG